MQLQHRQDSKRGESLNPNGNKGRGTSTPTQSQLHQHSPVAALRELIQRMHRSSSCGSSEGTDVKRTQKQFCCGNSNRPKREAVAERDVQPFRRLNTLDASGGSSSSRYRWHLSRCVNRSHPPKRSKSKGINLNNLQPPQPQRMSQSTQSSESESDVDADVSFQRPSPSPSNQGRSEEDEATSQLRKMCRDIIQSAEQGTSPPPRAQIKKVIAEYHCSQNNPISPRDPNFTEIPPEFSQILSYGIARSQTQTVQQSTVDPNNELTRRSRFAESYATKKILGDQK